MFQISLFIKISMGSSFIYGEDKQQIASGGFLRKSGHNRFFSEKTVLLSIETILLFILNFFCFFRFWWRFSQKKKFIKNAQYFTKKFQTQDLCFLEEQLPIPSSGIFIFGLYILISKMIAKIYCLLRQIEVLKDEHG